MATLGGRLLYQIRVLSSLLLVVVYVLGGGGQIQIQNTCFTVYLVRRRQHAVANSKHKYRSSQHTLFTHNNSIYI